MDEKDAAAENRCIDMADAIDALHLANTAHSSALQRDTEVQQAVRATLIAVNDAQNAFDTAVAQLAKNAPPNTIWRRNFDEGKSNGG